MPHTIALVPASRLYKTRRAAERRADNLTGDGDLQQWDANGRRVIFEVMPQKIPTAGFVVVARTEQQDDDRKDS